MDPALIGILTLGFGLFVGILYGDYRNNAKIADLRNQLDKAGSKKTKSKAPKKSAEKSNTSDSKALQKVKGDLASNKDELKKIKKQIYDLKEENKSLKSKAEKSSKKDKGGKSSKKDAEQIFSLREEIGELKATIANFETKRSETKVERVEEAPAVEIETNADGGVSEETLKEIRNQHRAEVKNIRNESQDEIRELKKKLKKASSNVDKQRRRADNSDKAYKINQRQIDAFQDRIKLLENGVPAYTPEPLKVQSPTLEPRKTVELKPEEPKKTRTPSDDAVEEPPPSVVAVSPDPLTLEMSADIADELLNEASEKTEASDADDASRSTQMLWTDNVADSDKPKESLTTTAILTPAEMAGAFTSDDEPKEEVPAARLGESVASVDDGWAEFDVD